LFVPVSYRAEEITMRRVVSLFLVTVCLVSQGVAEERVNVLPEIVIGGSAPEIVVGGSKPGSADSSRASVSLDRCVEVEIGSSRSMDCLNQKLKKEVDKVNPSMNLPPIDAKSQDIKVGVVNVPGVRQQYGRNFGVSVIPYRPAPPVFTSPSVIGRR
jgi:hypothetical protein